MTNKTNTFFMPTSLNWTIDLTGEYAVQCRLATRFLLSLSAILLIFVAVILNPPLPIDQICCDPHYYRSISYNFFDVARPDLDQPPPDYQKWPQWNYHDGPNGLRREPPFAYRIGAPLLARFLGRLLYQDDALQGFQLLSVLAYVVSTWLVGLLSLDLSRRTTVALAAQILFALNPWLVGHYLQDYVMADPLALAFLCLAVLLLWRRRYEWFLVVVGTGLFVKETLAFALACYPFVRWLEDQRDVRPILAVTVAALPYGLFRFLLPIPEAGYSLFSAWLASSPLLITERVTAIYGPLLILAALGLRRSRFLPKLLPMALGSVGAALFISEPGQSLIYAFPVVLLSVVALAGYPDRKERIA